MPMFRKKPMEVEAWQFSKAALDAAVGGEDAVPDFVLELLATDKLRRHPMFPDTRMQIETTEGNMIVDEGDWIALDVKGNPYPIKPDVFEASYDPAA